MEKDTVKLPKCEWVSKQTLEACNTHSVTLRNGNSIPVWGAYRCLFCGEYFSQIGAEEHFGKTRSGYNREVPRESVVEIVVGGT